MRIYESWIRAHLPKELAMEPIDCLSEEYLDGLTVMARGERGGDDVVVYRAKDEEDLKYWQLEQVCRFIHEPEPPARKVFRYERHHAEDGHWLYIEHRNYDYNAIDDARLYGFESFLRIFHFGATAERWEEQIERHVALMNFWYEKPHWDYDREQLCFIEISNSKEHDGADMIEEPRPGSVIELVD